MLWVLLFAAIALGGLVMVVCYGVWLAHKASDLTSEVVVLAQQAGQLAELAGQIGVPRTAGGPVSRRGATGLDDGLLLADLDVG